MNQYIRSKPTLKEYTGQQSEPKLQKRHERALREKKNNVENKKAKKAISIERSLLNKKMIPWLYPSYVKNKVVDYIELHLVYIKEKKRKDCTPLMVCFDLP